MISTDANVPLSSAILPTLNAPFLSIMDLMISILDFLAIFGGYQIGHFGKGTE
ncbi:MAG: hypothetical protein ACU0B7_03300 [Paracoccaceae bacterium]